MAIQATQIHQGGSGTDGTNFTTSSVACSANKLVLLAVGSDAGGGSAPVPTVSGGGFGTWTQIATSSTGARRVTLFSASATSTPTPATISITFGSTQNGANWSVTEFSEVSFGDNGQNGVVQSATNTGSAVTSLTVTLGAFSDTRNATYGVIQKNGAEVISSGSGFTELGENNAEASIQAQWKTSNDTTVDWSWATNHVVCGIAVEIKAESTSSFFPFM